MSEALSALIDGEDPGMDRAVLDSHATRCADCRRFRAGAEALSRRVRVRPAEAVPDTTAAILAALPGGLPPVRRTVPVPILAAAVAAVVVLAGLAFVGGRLVSSSGNNGQVAASAQVTGSTEQSKLYPGATVLPVTYTKPTLALTDTSGQPFSIAAQTAGKITLVYFGYTHCPDICPINMELTAAALRRLPAADRSKIAVVFITTDPDRDTPPVIRRWLDNFSSSFVGLAGTEDQIHQAERNVNMPLSYAQSAGGNYQVVHAGYTLVYTPDGIAHLQIDDTEQAGGFATTLERLVAHGFQAR